MEARKRESADLQNNNSDNSNPNKKKREINHTQKKKEVEWERRAPQQKEVDKTRNWLAVSSVFIFFI
jgi:hypothetical protein